VMEDLNSALPRYFLENIDKGTAESWVWEAHKGITRGILIKWGARIKKERASQIRSLTEAMSTTESNHKSNPTPEAYKTLSALRIEL
ncbi:Hypothetical predicted protein, partial [Pelobates cultripes]